LGVPTQFDSDGVDQSARREETVGMRFMSNPSEVPEVTVEDVLNFTAAARRFIEGSAYPSEEEILQKTCSNVEAVPDIIEPIVGPPPVQERRIVNGLAVILADVVLVNSHNTVCDKYPVYTQPDGENTKHVPVLYQGPLNGDYSDDWKSKYLDMEAIKKRYTQKREDGHSYCPLDTLTHVLCDLTRSKLPCSATAVVRIESGSTSRGFHRLEEGITRCQGAEL
jgi:hypothetical protein